MPKGNYSIRRLIAPTVNQEGGETLPSELKPIFQRLGFAYFPTIADGRETFEQSYIFRGSGVTGSVVQSLEKEEEIHLTLVSSSHGHKNEQDAITQLLLQLPMFKEAE